MAKPVLILLLSIILCPLVWAQDSLLRAQSSLEAGKLLRHTQPDSALYLLLQAEQLIPQKAPSAFRFQLHFALGRQYTVLLAYDSAQAQYQLALPYANASEKADTYLNLSVLALEQQHYDQAVAAARQAANQHAQATDSAGMAKAWMNLGTAYYKATAYDSAVYYYLQALAYFEGHQNPASIAKARLGLGSIHLDQGSYSEALPHYQAALSISQTQNDLPGLASAGRNLSLWHSRQGQTDSARVWLEKSAALYLQASDSLAWAEMQNLLGNLAYGAQRWTEAREYYQTYARHMEQAGKLGHLAEALNNLGAVYFFLDDYPQAQAYYQESLALARELKLYPLRASLYFNLSEVHEVQGRLAEALTWYKRYQSAKARLFDEERSRQIAEMQERYEAAEKDRQIGQLAQENALQTAEAQRRRAERNGLFIGLVALLATLIIGWQSFRQRQRSQREAARLREAEYQREVAQILGAQEVQTMEAQLAGENRERKRIAAELHDRVGSLLTATRLFVQAEGGLAEHQEKAGSLLEEAQQEVRRLSHAMNAEATQGRSLEDSLTHLTEAINSSGKLHIDLHLYGLQSALPQDSQRRIYRMVQELISNVLKHARATEAIVQLNRVEDQLLLMVEDNGVGLKSAEGTEGLGLTSLHEQVSGLQGTLEIDGQSGTTVTICLPWTNLEATSPKA